MNYQTLGILFTTVLATPQTTYPIVIIIWRITVLNEPEDLINLSPTVAISGWLRRSTKERQVYSISLYYSPSFPYFLPQHLPELDVVFTYLVTLTGFFHPELVQSSLETRQTPTCRTIFWWGALWHKNHLLFCEPTSCQPHLTFSGSFTERKREPCPPFPCLSCFYIPLAYLPSHLFSTPKNAELLRHSRVFMTRDAHF